MISSRSSSLSALSLTLLSLTVVCLLCLIPTATHGLFEEQAGVVDWHTAHIGSIESLLFRSSESTAVVTTSENVLAAINLGSTTPSASGETQWRQVLPEGEDLEVLTSYSKTRVLTLSTASSSSSIGVVRAWNSKDGSLVWDSQLTDLTKNMEEIVNQTTSALVQEKRRIQGVDHIDPSRANPSEYSHSDLTTVSDTNADGKSDVLALNDNKVFLLSGVDGSIVWSWSKASFAGFRILIQDGKVAVVGQEKAGSVIVHLLQLADGKELSSKSISFSPVVSKLNLQVLPSGSVVLLNPATKTITVVSLFTAASKDAKDVSFDLAKQGLASANAHFELLGSSDGKSYLVVYGSQQQLIVEVTATSINKINSFTTSKGDDVEFTLARDGSESKTIELIRAVLSKGKLTVESFSLTSSSPTQSLVSQQPFTNRGGLKQIWVDSSAGKKNTRVLISTVDDALTLFQGGVSQWTREEALASILRVQFVELPAGSTDLDDESSGTYPNFFQRIVPQVRSIVGSVIGLVNPQIVVKKVNEALANAEATIQALSTGGAVGGGRTIVHSTTFARPLPKADSLLTQDYFGFRKLILANTASGKLYALESESGQIVWSKFLHPGAGSSDQDLIESDEQITPAWKVHVLSHHEAVAIVHENSKTHLIAFNPLTGDIIKGASMTVDFTVSTSIVLPYIESHNRHILLVASVGAAQVQVFPNSDEVRSIVANKANDIFFYTVDTEQQVLQGFNLQADAKSKNAISAVQTWSTRFPVNQERIVSIAARASNEVIQSGVRVLGGGDGGYLYKYLNPNLLAIATIRSTPTTSGATSNLRVVPSLKRTTDPSVNLYLLDTITGTILDKFVHRGCEGPVTVLQTENTILYHYFNAQAHQYEVSSIELYETREGTGEMIGNSGVTPISGTIFDGLTSISALSSLGRSTVAPFNSFQEPAPQSIQQTFTFKSAIKSLGVTQTRRGITMKEFLIGLPTDQLYTLPKLLVDPRRPIGEPTTLDRMEGLIPYTSELPIDPLRIVSHVHTIGHLKSIVSSHALLESTSLVCAYGIDLFCIRLNPSQTFDLLNEDFNSPFLIATVTAVFVAIVFTRRLAKAKELKAAWK